MVTVSYAHYQGGTGLGIPPVHPQATKKKMDASRTGAHNAKLSTLEHIKGSTDGMASSAATDEALNK
jgi:hypothetical protein